MRAHNPQHSSPSAPWQFVKKQEPVHIGNYENLGCMYSNDVVPLIHVYILLCKHFLHKPLLWGSPHHRLFMVTIRWLGFRMSTWSTRVQCIGVKDCSRGPLLLCCMLLLTEHLVAKIYGWKMLRRPIFPSSRYINVWQDRLLIFTAYYRGGGL